MLKLNNGLCPDDLTTLLDHFWELSEKKIKSIEKGFDSSLGAPVFTVKGKFTARGWTDWTQGFQYGSPILQFDVTGEKAMLETAKKHIVEKMSPHISNTGVHDHGFNNISTYGNLLRLMNESKISFNEWEKNFYELALKVSGAVQASRWTVIKDGGFIYSFNGPHSLFVDTIRSCRSLVLSHKLGQVLQGEGDVKINLLVRALQHILITARYSVFYGEGRDAWDVKGRTAHESIFNVKDGNYRCPNSQQGYSGFTTWTRGIAWAMCGFTEQLEWMGQANQDEFESSGGKENLLSILLKAAKATCDFYIQNTPSDGIPYWDSGAPSLFKMGNYLEMPADPYNEYEPVDSSAAAIASQGLLRLGHYLTSNGKGEEGKKYWLAGLTIVKTLLGEPYLSTSEKHQGLLLHSVYHQPNGWDYKPAGSKIPYGESSMWGDYHMREVCLYLNRIIKQENYYTYFNGIR